MISARLVTRPGSDPADPSADDPWADWWQIKVCNVLDATCQLIGKWRLDMDNLLALQAAGRV